jgi:hypothetical protein
MKCPKCQAENDLSAKFCTECGEPLQSSGPKTPGTAQLAGNTGILLGAKAREARKQQVVDPNAILSDRVYNSVIVGVLLWGLLVNYLLCRFATGFAMSLNPWVLLIGYIVLAIGGVIISAKSQNPAISFLGYNMVVVPFGLVISLIVKEYGGIDSDIVMQAFLYTALIAVGMMALVMIVPQFFAKIGGALTAALIGMVLCEIILLIFGIHQSWMDWVVAGLFSLYIGYDIYRSQQFPKTLDNAVDSALDIYMDMANLFIRILAILGKKDD